MALGAGKYDDVTTYVREQTQALGVIVIVMRGNWGDGFSCQFADPRLPTVTPQMLRITADAIERDMKQGIP